MSFDEELIVRPRLIKALLFFAVPIGGFSLYAVAILVNSIIVSAPDIVLVVLFSVFALMFLYMAVTAMLAFLWTFLGKERIAVNSNNIVVAKILFFRFSVKHYDVGKISGLYVDSKDWMKNKISRGRNDFLVVFRIGTVHFKYQDRLVHIGGGLTDEEARMFLVKLKQKGLVDFN